MGVKFGMEKGTFMPNFTPIGATCRPCGAKNIKIRAACAARNAAGKYITTVQ